MCRDQRDGQQDAHARISLGGEMDVNAQGWAPPRVNRRLHHPLRHAGRFACSLFGLP
jgi:hypothetical protein